MDNYVGKRLDGRYEVQEIVGVGGMSVVYKAYDNVDDRIVAVKILKDEFLNNEEFKRRFKNESKAIALLSHPNIVKVYDVNFGEKLQYIVMEYIDGITLKEYINKQGAITWNDALFFMTQILKAVQHAHDKGIVHRDIKPQNIILLSTGNIKVTDFGIARFSRSETKTLTESAIGSVHYISPEQAKGEYTDEKADIYSIGVVLYEMLSGTVPFEADSAVSVALMQLQADAKRLTDINADIPLGLEQICIHAMQKSSQDRYQTATEMLLDIEEVIKNPDITFNYSANTDNSPTRVMPKGITADIDIPETEEYDNEYDYDYEQENKNKKKVITAVVIGVVVLIAAIVLLVMGVTGSFNTSTVQLENFVGMSYDDLLEQGTYEYQFVAEYEKTSDTESGLVISQQPVAGSKVLEGSQVILIVAASEDDISVPSVYGMTEEKAKLILEREGLFKYKTVFISSESIEEGKVVYTEPKASMIVNEDREVVLYISTGPSTTAVNTITVPDVTGLTKSGARAFLEKYGFTNISFVTEASDLDKDLVFAQEPSAGQTALSSDEIKIFISSGETTTTAPATVRISFKVILPKFTDENGNAITDTLEVKIDDKTYFKQTQLALDGKTTSMDITVEQGLEQNIIVSLVNKDFVYSTTITGTADERFDVDFSGYSQENA